MSLGQSFGWLDGTDTLDPNPDSIIVLSSAGAFNSIETDGTQVTISGVTGPGSTNLNGGTFYVKTIASEDIGPGYGGSGSAVYLYTDVSTTTLASATTVGVVSDFGPPNPTGTGNGTVAWPITGTAAKEWELELEASQNDLKLKADDVTKVTFTTAGDVTATGTVSGDIGDFESVPLKQFTETVVALGDQTGDISSSLNANNGSIYTLTATGDLTIDSLANAQAGTSMTIIVTQDGTGSRTLASAMRFEGGSTTLSSGSGARDVISVFFDGSDYYAKIGLNYS